MVRRSVYSLKMKSSLCYRGDIRKTWLSIQAHRVTKFILNLTKLKKYFFLLIKQLKKLEGAQPQRQTRKRPPNTPKSRN